MIEVRYLGLLENIYSIEGEHCHQIVLVFDGRLSDHRLYDQETIQGDELGEPFQAVWKRLDEFQAPLHSPESVIRSESPGKPPVYPDGLIELITS